jgi:hypothetical protein
MSIGPVSCEQCSQSHRCSDRRYGELFGCFDHCVDHCNKSACNLTCPFNEPEYSRRMMEVNWRQPLRGVVPDIEAGVVPPLHLPQVFGHTNRDTPLAVPWAAVPYHRLFREVGRRCLEPVATSPLELRQKFMLAPDTRIAGISSAHDIHLERMWEYYRVTDMAAALKSMDVSFATAPNFSFWTIAPRPHNEWNFRRMALFTLRLWEGGFRMVPHVYAERDADWLDRAAFFVDHPQLDTFAFELQTGDAAPMHVPRLRRQMALFLDKVGRPLRMVVSGGAGAAVWLPQVFPDLTIVEGDSYVKAIKRRQLFLLRNGKVRPCAIHTIGSVSDLLFDNIRTTGAALEIRRARALCQTEKIGMAAA